MNFFNKIFKRSNDVSVQIPDALETIDDKLTYVLAGGSTSKNLIGQDAALAITTVWACVSLLSESVGILPIHLYKKTANGREVVRGHRGWQVINNPNSYISRMDFLQHLMVGALLWGNGYARIYRDKNGFPTKIKLLKPTDVTPVLSPDDELFYNIDGEYVYYEDVIHIKGLVINDLQGKSPISVHRENLSLTREVQSYGERFFSNGGNTSGVFELPGTLRDDAYDRLKKDVRAQFCGIENSHVPLILEGGMKYSRINIPLEDAQFLTTRKFQRGEIASIFRVPPHMIGDLERATFSNIEQQSQEYVTYCLMPYLTKMEQEFASKLLTVEEQENFYFKFNLTGLLRADSKSRSEYYKNLNLIGCLSANEIRELEEMNGYEGGDFYFVQQNMMKVDKQMNNVNEKGN